MLAVYVVILPCKSFEELFKRMHEYKGLMESKQAQKISPTVTVNAITRAGGYKQHEKKADQNQSYRRDFKKGDGSYNNDRPPRQWRKNESYSFDVADTERWFEALVAANVISALEAKYEVSEEEKGIISTSITKLRGHSTMECHTLCGLIQKFFKNVSCVPAIL